MKKMEHKIIIFAAIAIVMGVIIALASYLSAKNIKEMNGAQNQEVSTETPATSDNEKTTTTTTPPPAKLTYGQAVVKYSASRIQFDSNCVATPVIATYKNGTELMIDNRAGVQRTFSVDGTRYTIAAQDYKIIKLTAKTFPYTIQIDCGSGKNNANIYLQK